MNNLHTVSTRVANWNSKRYDRIYDQGLALRLLREEYREWLEADRPVDKLDALCDITYVALGVVWKAEISFEDMQDGFEAAHEIILSLVDNLEVNPAYLISTLLDVYEFDNEMPLSDSIGKVILAAGTQAMGMGLTWEQFMDACIVVCDSNDSKSIKGKVAANVKANDKDKGAYFVPPEPRLQLILDKAVSFN